MAYKTTASLDKLSYTDYVNFGKRQDRFGQFSLSKIESNYLVNAAEKFAKEEKLIAVLIPTMSK